MNIYTEQRPICSQKNCCAKFLKVGIVEGGEFLQTGLYIGQKPAAQKFLGLEISAPGDLV